MDSVQTEQQKLPPANVLVLVAAFALAYLPCLGRGFIKDDFAWILGSRVRDLADLSEVLARDNGFYRPLVTLSFTASERLFGLEPLGYGITNFVLVIACAGLVQALARKLGMPPAAAATAAALWAFNPHGINWAVLWISGRTALLLTLFSLAAAIAVLTRKPLIVSLMCGLAVLSKEEAVVLPAIFAVSSGLRAPGERPPHNRVMRMLWGGGGRLRCRLFCT
jgi:protein O-mannosyl-transferase